MPDTMTPGFPHNIVAMAANEEKQHRNRWALSSRRQATMMPRTPRTGTNHSAEPPLSATLQPVSARGKVPASRAGVMLYDWGGTLAAPQETGWRVGRIGGHGDSGV